MRGALYVDGFNLYHAINDLDQPHLKWLDLRRLAEVVARGHARTITRVIFCSAYFKNDHSKNVRHRLYVDALKNVGVEVRLGHTTRERVDCVGCGRRWEEPREKETDINLALAILDDAYQDVFDTAFLLTADTDQAATFRTMRERFPRKRLVSVVPPGRFPSKHLLDLADAKINLTPDHLDQCVMPPLVAGDGRRAVPRPMEYAPPEGWIHPVDRPQRS